MDSLLNIWIHDRGNYPWWRPFVLTDDTLVIAVGGSYTMGPFDKPYIGVGCTGNYAGLYYRIVRGGQEVALP